MRGSRVDVRIHGSGEPVVLPPQTSQMQHHWQKLAVEERPIASGLGFTILRPAASMQNLVPYGDEIVEEGVHRVPCDERESLSLVDLEDLAEVAAAVLTSQGGTREH